MRYHSDLEFLIFRWSCESHRFIFTWGEFEPTLEDVARLTMLSMSGDKNAIRVVIEGKDEAMLHDLCHDPVKNVRQVVI